MLWKNLKKLNSDFAEMFNPAKRNGKLVLSKGDKILIVCFAPILIAFFTYIIFVVENLLGKGFVDNVVRIFLIELYISFLIFLLLALLVCFFRTRWLENLLATKLARLMLKAGIVGLPNVGKSTLFNAVTRMRKAEVA